MINMLTEITDSLVQDFMNIGYSYKDAKIAAQNVYEEERKM